MKDIKRNDPCPCGSGKKYKKCCAGKSPLQRHTFTHLQEDKRVTEILSKKREPEEEVDPKS